MLKPLKLVPSPEDQFIQRYERLHEWALTLTNGDQELAEDLVHDAFIQFTLRRTDLRTIENTDGYLHRMLRNMHLSEVRRFSHLQRLPLSVADYDSAELGLRVVDPQTQLQVADELRRICQYASERKETSKAGSVLILRFFHGYYLGEIARVLNSPLPPVYDWLKIARREVKLYLAEPASLKFFVNLSPIETLRSGEKQTPIELMRELSNTIFNSRRGACHSRTRLRQAYTRADAEKLDCPDIAHVVSCPVCLDEVNEMLDLPPLAERFPTDTLGPSDRRGGGGGDEGGPTDGGLGASLTTELKRRHRRRYKDVFDHRPQELRISVNGFLLASQKIGHESNEQSLSVNIDERIGFVEVFSEQGVRLLFFEVDQPVDGDVEQKAEAKFSDGRRLELKLSYRTAWPTLHVLYRDPVLAEIQGQEREVHRPTSNVESRALAVKGPPSRVRNVWFQARRRWSNFALLTLARRLFFRPSTVTAIFAVILIGVVLFVQFRRLPPTTVSAAELLRQSAVLEETLAARTDQVLHRTINVEEHRAGASDVTARRSVEIWESSVRGVKALRVYDEKGYLVAGEWTRRDGSRTIYHHGSQPRNLTPEKGLSLSSENVWWLVPSAKDFTTLTGGDLSGTLSVRQQATAYVITYGGDAEDSRRGLLKATLTLSRNDLHALALTLVVRDDDSNPTSENHRGPQTGVPGGPARLGWKQGSSAGVVRNPQFREYHFVEASFERRAPNTVAPSVFDPDPELLPGDKGTRRNGDTKSLPPSLGLPFSPSRVVATAELEVEVLRLLNDAGADLNDQTSVTRTSEGKLRIGGLVETEQRKAEIFRALTTVINDPAIQVQIETFAEAIRRQTRTPSSPAQAEVQRVEIAQARTPVYEDLRKYFRRNAKDESQAEEASRQFAGRTLSRSSLAMSHAGTMRRIARQFSPDDLRAMSPEAKAKWILVIKAHARVFEHEARRLRQELQPIFPNARVDQAPSGIDITDEASLIRAVELLFEQGSSTDDVIRSAFAVTQDAAATSAIKTLQFWKSLRSAEHLAEKIVRSQ